MLVIAVPCLIALAAVMVALRANAAVERARGSERRLRQLIGSCNELTFALLDRDLRITVIEGPGVERNGFPAREMAGVLLTDAIAREHVERLRPYVEQAFAGESARVQWDSERGEGVFKIDFAPFSEGDEITHVAVTVREIGAGVALQREL